MIAQFRAFTEALFLRFSHGKTAVQYSWSCVFVALRVYGASKNAGYGTEPLAQSDLRHVVCVRLWCLEKRTTRYTTSCPTLLIHVASSALGKKRAWDAYVGSALAMLARFTRGALNNNYGRIRFILYLKHVPSFDESGSSYIYNTPSHLASLVHNISYTLPFIWQFRLLIYLKHAPSFGDSGSTYILNTPPLRRFSVHHVS